jgi:hypothetical protein
LSTCIHSVRKKKMPKMPAPMNSDATSAPEHAAVVEEPERQQRRGDPSLQHGEGGSSTAASTNSPTLVPTSGRRR